jgi:hypothetical protein
VKFWAGSIWLKMVVQFIVLVNTEMCLGFNKGGTFLGRLIDRLLLNRGMGIMELLLLLFC